MSSEGDSSEGDEEEEEEGGEEREGNVARSLAGLAAGEKPMEAVEALERR